jgi:hypothetical protein
MPAMDTKSHVFVGAWFGTAIISLLFSLTLLVYISSEKKINYVANTYQLYQALPSNQTEIDQSISHQDARAKIVENFFKGYKSVLANYSSDFVETADKYDLDYRLLPSIAMQESNGGRITPHDSYNPFGYGIYGGKVARFNDWDEAIERVGRGIREDYVNKGLTTPEEIMAKYTPPSLEKGGAWAKGVQIFMAELR